MQLISQSFFFIPPRLSPKSTVAPGQVAIGQRSPASVVLEILAWQTMRTSRRACSSFVLAGHPVLRRVATPVRGVAARADLPRLDAALRSALGEHYGVAAPQLGTSARVFLLRAHADDEPWIAINPSIQRRSREMVAGWETCLSVPGYAASVERPAAVDVRYERLDGTAVERRLRGFEARVFQHELDHLDGILFTDKCARCLHRRRGLPLSPRRPARPQGRPAQPGARELPAWRWARLGGRVCEPAAARAGVRGGVRGECRRGA